MNCKKKKEYKVGKVTSPDPFSYPDEKESYWIGKSSDGIWKYDYNLVFENEHEADRVCKYLNEELDKRVDEKLERMFHCGEIELPFDFLKEWDSFNEKKIVERFNSWNFENKYKGFRVVCHFKSDLLVLSNVPSDLTPNMICEILNIRYEPFYGAGTFCSEYMILNVAKVREEC